MSRRQGGANLLWEHFDKKDEVTGICKYCSVSISYKSTIGNLRSHLKKKHPQILIQEQPHTTPSAPQQVPSQSMECGEPQTVVSACSASVIISSSATAFTELSNKRQRTETEGLMSYMVKPISQDTKKKIDRDLLNLFIEDMRPFSIIDNKGFRKLLSWIPGYIPPSRKTISNSLIPALYSKSSTECRNIIDAEVASVCITTDCWTSCNNESYIAVTAQFISPDFIFKSILLACQGCPGSHTSEYLGQKIKQIVKEWNIFNKINFAVSDNAHNICNAIQTGLGWKHYSCFAHSLNLISKDALTPVQDTLEKVKRIVAHFKRSTQAAEKNIKFQCNLGTQQPKRLIMEVATRWNSTYLMLKRFLELSEAVRATMAVINREWPILTEEEWAVLRLLEAILAPFEEITNSFGVENYVTGGLAIVLTNCLKDFCEELLLNSTYMNYITLQDVLLKIKSGIDTRFRNIENSKSLALCALLDPRFKLAMFKNDSSKISVKQNCQHLMEEILSRQPTIETVASQCLTNNTSVWNKIDRLIKSNRAPGTPLSRALREIKLYIEDEMLPRQGPDGKWNDPTEWWSRHSKVYPTLAEIYRTRCNIVITSIPCERIFSKTGYILSERRTRLTTSKLEQLIFLNANAKFLCR